jgi:hypothetical protein
MNKIDSFFRKVDTAGKASGNAQPLGLKNSSAAHPAEPAKKAPPATKGAVPPAEGQENDAAATVGGMLNRVFISAFAICLEPFPQSNACNFAVHQSCAGWIQEAALRPRRSRAGPVESLVGRI